LDPLKIGAQAAPSLALCVTQPSVEAFKIGHRGVRYMHWKDFFY